jgi:LysM repeat protein
VKTPLKSLRVMLLLLGLAVVVAACVPFVGDGPDEEEPTPGVIPTVIRPTQESSQAPAAASPIPTLVPLPTRASQSATSPPSCTPRTDWPEYTVQSGDTLYSIALRSDSTVDTLQAANCLADPNAIFEGQSLRVPKQPEPREIAATPGPTATPQPGFFARTPTPGATGDVTFTFVAANDSATKVTQGSFRALKDPVSLSVSVTNVSRIEVVRADGKILASTQAPSGSPNAGGTFPLRRLDISEGQSFLIVYIRATKPDGTTKESDPVRFSWP